MPDDPGLLQKRIDELAADVRSLTKKIDRLSGEIADLKSAASASPGRSAGLDRDPGFLNTENPIRDHGLPAESGAAVSDDLVSWVGRASLLTRISALSFLLVVALGLRTITDYGLIGKEAGLLIGMSYATLLMIAGWFLYRVPSAVAPVFAVCGSVLMAAVVLEMHVHYGSLSSVSAYLVLTLTAGAMAMVSRQFNKFLPVSCGILGLSVGAVVIDYPAPHKVLLLSILVVANVLGFSAASIRRCSWLRWTVLAVTAGTVFLWVVQLRFVVLNHLPPRPGLMPWVLVPGLVVVGLTTAVLALLGILRSGPAGRQSRFDLALPTLNATWIFLALRYSEVVDLRWLGAAGMAFAALQMATAWWLAVRRDRILAGAEAFAMGAIVLLPLALPLLVGNTLLAFPLLSLAALGLAALSQRWGSGVVRLTSHLLQIYAGIHLSIFLSRNARFSVSPVSALAAAAPAVISFLHFRWARISVRKLFLAGTTREDRDPVALFLLIASLVSAFFMIRVGLYQALRYLPGSIDNSFRGAQSIVISISAAVIMILAASRRDRDLRNVAFFVTFVGAIRVANDLLGTHGIPLVLSVFTFGLSAALQSAALRSWSRRHAAAPEESRAAEAPAEVRAERPAPAELSAP